MYRPSKDEYYLGIAEAVSHRATCLRRRYGAIIVVDDEIVSTGYNGAPRQDINCCDKGMCERERLNVPPGERYELCLAVHAEQNAIISAARKDTAYGTLYIAGRNVADGSWAKPDPCLLCKKMIKNTGIKLLVLRGVNGEIITKEVSVM